MSCNTSRTNFRTSGSPEGASADSLETITKKSCGTVALGMAPKVPKVPNCGSRAITKPQRFRRHLAKKQHPKTSQTKDIYIYYIHAIYGYICDIRLYGSIYICIYIYISIYMVN